MSRIYQKENKDLEHLKKKYNSDDKPVKIKDKKLIENIIKFELKIYNDLLSSLNNFKNYLNENNLLKKYINSYNNSKDRDSKIDKIITNELLEDVYKFMHGNIDIFYKYNKTELYKKPKIKNPKKPSDYRYLTNHTNFIKILDRIFININNRLVNKNFIDKNIFIVNILDIKIENCSFYADKNTKSKDRVLCLDFSNAFDNVEWYKLKYHMFNFYKKSMLSELAEALTDFYFFILQNRDFYYNNSIIKVKKGISQGLPSSNLIFSIFMIQIIENWKHKVNLNIDDYLDINIYVDDVYIKFKSNNEMNNYLLYKLIKEFEANNIVINNNKCFGDSKLNLNFEYRQIKNNDFYLGIPFTREIDEYLNYIMDNFKNKFEIKKIYIKKYKKYDIEYSWNNFIDIIIKNKKEKKIIIGFFAYKLRPLYNYFLCRECLGIFKFTNGINLSKYTILLFIILVGHSLIIQ